MRVPSFLMIACAVLLLSGCGTSPESARRDGVDWLIDNQNADGSWGSFESSRSYEVMLGTQASHDGFGLACVALDVMALHEPSHNDEQALAAMIDGLDLLLTEDSPGRATGSVFYDTWAHTYILQACAQLYHDPRLADRQEQIGQVARREIVILADRQGGDGGWCYYDFGHSRQTPTGNMSTSFNTASVLIALHQARQAGFDVSDDVIHDGLNALARLRFPNGAYAYSLGHRMYPQGSSSKIQGSIGRAQVCNLALYLWGRDVTLDDLDQGINDLRKWHHYILIGKGRPWPHEAWYATAGYYFLFGHYYAGRVIELLPDPQRSDHAQWLGDTIAGLSNDDGSWMDFPLYNYYKAYGTGFGVMTLQSAQRAIENDTDDRTQGGE